MPKSSPDEELNAFEARRAERELMTLRAANKQLRSENKQLGKDLAIAERGHSLRHEFASNMRLEAPRWAQSRRKASKAGDRRALLHYDLSDWHFDEVVDPAQVHDYNAYNRSIATIRLQQWAEKAVRVPQFYLSGYDVEGAVFALLGDMFSGEIHPELAETNEAPMIAGLVYWIPRVKAALTFVADELKIENAHVIGVVGNHGRTKKKSPMKFRAESNFDFLLYEMLALTMHEDRRFTFHIPTAADCHQDWYGYRYLYTHGDSGMSGGSGWAGIAMPINKNRTRRALRDSIVSRPAYRMHIGHYHTYWPAAHWSVNGSGVGYQEYPFIQAFEPEEPMQAFHLITPEHGATMFAPILVSAGRKREGW